MKLLYLSCHEVLEFDELALFHELGIEVFSTGDYMQPEVATARLRPSLITMRPNLDDVEAYRSMAPTGYDPRECLTREFVDRFDVVLVMHKPEWIVRNWEAIRHRSVVWRTIGQSLPDIEQTMQSYRGDGLRIVRYSPNERRLANFAGEDALIRFYKDPNDWQGWTGERPVVVCFSQSMPSRPLHCNYRLFQEATDDLGCELYGPGNEDAGPIWKGCLTYAELQSVLRSSRVCFHTGTFPASYTLGFVEAWMIGIPVVAIGSRSFGRVDGSLCDLYEVPEVIEHEVSGFVSDDVEELHSCLECVLAHWEYAREISRAGRAMALRHFDKSTALERWREFFQTI